MTGAHGRGRGGEREQEGKVEEEMEDDDDAAGTGHKGVGQSRSIRPICRKGPVWMEIPVKEAPGLPPAIGGHPVEATNKHGTYERCSPGCEA